MILNSPTRTYACLTSKVCTPDNKADYFRYNLHLFPVKLLPSGNHYQWSEDEFPVMALAKLAFVATSSEDCRSS